MTKFYVIEISEGDSKIAGKSVYEYADEDYETARTNAVSSFHKKLGTAMGSELFTSELVMAVDGNGKILKNEKWTKPIIVEKTVNKDVSETTTDSETTEAE